MTHEVSSTRRSWRSREEKCVSRLKTDSASARRRILSSSSAGSRYSAERFGSVSAGRSRRAGRTRGWRRRIRPARSAVNMGSPMLRNSRSQPALPAAAACRSTGLTRTRRYSPLPLSKARLETVNCRTVPSRSVMSTTCDAQWPSRTPSSPRNASSRVKMSSLRRPVVRWSTSLKKIIRRCLSRMRKPSANSSMIFRKMSVTGPPSVRPGMFGLHRRV